MDENTKHIVASNLTVAYYIATKEHVAITKAIPAANFEPSQDQITQPFALIIATYQSFLLYLGGASPASDAGLAKET